VRKFSLSRRPVLINLDEYRASLSRSEVARPENNFYHWLLGTSWTSFLLLVVFVYLSTNCPLKDYLGKTAIEQQWHLLITFTGYYESLANQVYARHVYLPRDVQQNASFVDIVTVSPDGGRVIDLNNFDKWIPNTSDKLVGEFL
jgi:hypothetical protein